MHDFEPLPELPHIAIASVSAAELSNPGVLGAEMLAEMKSFPSLRAVISVAPDGEILVASRENAVAAPRYDGVFEVVQRLASSPSIKEQARKYPSEFTTVRAVNDEGTLHRTHVPAGATAASVGKALAEGAQPNRDDLVQQTIDSLPKGKRVALLVTGPPGSGKSGLIDKLTRLAEAGGRNVGVLQGDMYFKLDRTGLPQTAEGGPYWDHPAFMEMGRLKDDIARLITDGEADTPIFRFEDVLPPSSAGDPPRPRPVQPTKHVSLGTDDILIIDSLHAANEEIVSHLEKLGLDHATVFLDSPTPETRMVRRIVRDYHDRGGWLAQESMQGWDTTTWKGEVEFVRPTLLQMDPTTDTFLVTSFPKDVFLTRAQIDERIDQMEHFGIPPSYEAFSTPAEGLPALAQAERQKLEGLTELTDVQKKSLGRLQNAPANKEVG